MKKIIITLFILIPIIAFSQDKDTYTCYGKEYPLHKDGDNSYFITEDDTIYSSAEQMPEFKGGQKKLFEQISRVLKYPAEAKANNIQGRVFISFLITKKGELTNIVILKNVHKILDDEAIRVVKQIPNNWNPGTHDDKPVNTIFIMPLNFTLK